jgi:hypothetical protein
MAHQKRSRAARVLIGGAAVLGVALALGALWLGSARQLAGLVDRGTVARVASLSPSPFGWNGTWLQFGPPLGAVEPGFVGRLPGIEPDFRVLDLTGPGPLYAPAAEIAVDAGGRLALSAGGRSLALGTRSGTIPGYGGGEDMPGFVAEPGDAASVTIDHGLAWPTPFDFGFMPGAATTWRRHVYYRLWWRKASGARLDMLWVADQPYDGVNLWRAPGGFLVRVEIRPAPG